MDRVEKVARAICLTRDIAPDAREPGSDAYGDDTGVHDGRDADGPFFFVWRLYVPHARAAIAAIEADVREECAKIADDHAEAIDAMPSSDAVDDAGRKMAALIAHAIRRAGNA